MVCYVWHTTFLHQFTLVQSTSVLSLGIFDASLLQTKKQTFIYISGNLHFFRFIFFPFSIIIFKYLGMHLIYIPGISSYITIWSGIDGYILLSYDKDTCECVSTLVNYWLFAWMHCLIIDWFPYVPIARLCRVFLLNVAFYIFFVVFTIKFYKIFNILPFWIIEMCDFRHTLLIIKINDANPLCSSFISWHKEDQN